jgi:hypothetical protein
LTSRLRLWSDAGGVTETPAVAEIDAFGLNVEYAGALVDLARITEPLARGAVPTLAAGLASGTGDAHAQKALLAVGAVVADLSELPGIVVRVLESPRQAHPDFFIGATPANAAFTSDAMIAAVAASAGSATSTGSARTAVTAVAAFAAGTTLTSDAAFTSGAAFASRTAGAARAAGATFTGRATFAAAASCATDQLLGPHARQLVFAKHDLRPALLHAVLPIDRRVPEDSLGAHRTATALGRLETCVTVVDRLHTREKKRGDQSEGPEKGSGSHRDGM